MVKDQQISNEQGKEITQLIIDGDERMPKEIADSLGFLGEVLIGQDIKDAVTDVVKKNPEIVQLVLKTNKASPLMSLVKKVMEQINRKTDPVVVQ